jgi:hypothetical protein
MAQSKLAAAPRLGARPGVPLPGIGRAIILTSLAILTIAAVVFAADGIVAGLSTLSRAPGPAGSPPRPGGVLGTAFLAPAGVATLVVVMGRSFVRHLTRQGAR